MKTSHEDDGARGSSQSHHLSRASPTSSKLANVWMTGEAVVTAAYFDMKFSLQKSGLAEFSGV